MWCYYCWGRCTVSSTQPWNFGANCWRQCTSWAWKEAMPIPVYTTVCMDRGRTSYLGIMDWRLLSGRKPQGSCKGKESDDGAILMWRCWRHRGICGMQDRHWPWEANIEVHTTSNLADFRWQNWISKYGTNDTSSTRISVVESRCRTNDAREADKVLIRSRQTIVHDALVEAKLLLRN